MRHPQPPPGAGGGAGGGGGGRSSHMVGDFLLADEGDGALADLLGTTPPRERIRNKSKRRAVIEAAGIKINTKDIYDPTILGRRVSSKLQRKFERDSKLGAGSSSERADSLPATAASAAASAAAVPTLVESCSRFMSLASRLKCREQDAGCGGDAGEGEADDLEPPLARRGGGGGGGGEPGEEELPPSRVNFHKTFSMLINMGNIDKGCRRTISREEQVWQNELKDLIWLELVARVARRSLAEQDAFLCAQRTLVPDIITNILTFKFVNKNPCPSASRRLPVDRAPQSAADAENDLEIEDEGACCLSFHCAACTGAVGAGLRAVAALLDAYHRALTLYPSSHALTHDHPPVATARFKSRLKALCLWYNTALHMRLKVVAVRRMIRTMASKQQRQHRQHRPARTDTDTGDNRSEAEPPRACTVRFELSDTPTPSSSNNSNHSDCSRHKDSGKETDDDAPARTYATVIENHTERESQKPARSQDEEDTSKDVVDRVAEPATPEIVISDARYDTADTADTAASSESGYTSAGDTHHAHHAHHAHRTHDARGDHVYDIGDLSDITQLRLLNKAPVSIYRSYHQEMLKTQGVRRCMSFINKMRCSLLHKVYLTFEHPHGSSAPAAGAGARAEAEAGAEGEVFDDAREEAGEAHDDDHTYELKRYGCFSAEALAMRLPSYRSHFLLLCCVCMEGVHDYLELRLQDRPDNPSCLTVKQDRPDNPSCLTVKQVCVCVCVCVCMEGVHDYLELRLQDRPDNPSCLTVKQDRPDNPSCLTVKQVCVCVCVCVCMEGVHDYLELRLQDRPDNPSCLTVKQVCVCVCVCVCMEGVHDYLELRLQDRPDNPSCLTVKQLIHELKEGLDIATEMRADFARNIQVALAGQSGTDAVRSDLLLVVRSFDDTVETVLKQYLSYLRTMSAVEQMSRASLQREWDFTARLAKRARCAVLLAPTTFSEIACNQLDRVRKQFEQKFEQLDEFEKTTVDPDNEKHFVYTICRAVQAVYASERDAALHAAQWARCLASRLARNPHHAQPSQRIFRERERRSTTRGAVGALPGEQAGSQPAPRAAQPAHLCEYITLQRERERDAALHAAQWARCLASRLARNPHHAQPSQRIFVSISHCRERERDAALHAAQWARCLASRLARNPHHAQPSQRIFVSISHCRERERERRSTTRGAVGALPGEQAGSQPAPRAAQPAHLCEYITLQRERERETQHYTRRSGRAAWRAGWLATRTTRSPASASLERERDAALHAAQWARCLASRLARNPHHAQPSQRIFVSISHCRERERDAALHAAQWARCLASRLARNPHHAQPSQRIFDSLVSIRDLIVAQTREILERSRPDVTDDLRDSEALGARVRELMLQIYRLGFELHKELYRFAQAPYKLEQERNARRRPVSLQPVRALDHRVRQKRPETMVVHESLNPLIHKELHRFVHDSSVGWTSASARRASAVTSRAGEGEGDAAGDAGGGGGGRPRFLRSESIAEDAEVDKVYENDNNFAENQTYSSIEQFLVGAPAGAGAGAGAAGGACVPSAALESRAAAARRACTQVVARAIVDFAHCWMQFVIERCEKGRGLRPRWAHQGLEFLMLACDPRNTRHLSDQEFDDLKRKMDACISHVIGSRPPTPRAAPAAASPPAPDSANADKARRRPNRIHSPLPPGARHPAPSTPPLDHEPNFNFPEVDFAAHSARVYAATRRLDAAREQKLAEARAVGRVLVAPAPAYEPKLRQVNFKWQRGLKIGQGTFGKVYTVVNTETGQLLAMKEIAVGAGDRRALQRAANELRVLEGVIHPHLVRYYGAELHREEMLLFMELCVEGSLEALLAASGALQEQMVRRYTKQLTSAIAELHKQGVAHRDIKSGNIFLTNEGHCLKLGDFGCAVKIRAHTTARGELVGHVGTQAYMAPEVFMKATGHGRAADVWSLGCVVAEMASGKRPFSEYDSNVQIMFVVGMGGRPDIPPALSAEGRAFCASALTHEPDLRPSAQHLLMHHFLKLKTDDECECEPAYLLT
ncbi:hypothetical protein O0L34_g16914 [Tuta absoluta]|nr:hypothetical protein O0L34_g16914 [Tuta absoluta]